MRDSPVVITHTTPNYGGRRYWFIGPLSHNGQPCGRRVSKIYSPPGGTFYGCRDCYDLTYQSTCNDPLGKVDNRLWKNCMEEPTAERHNLRKQPHADEVGDVEFASVYALEAV